MTYLLLRDNKQSGPYTSDELKVKGLKAYDLVWVEGRSAAWRYPSEIDELSAFAPAVEEQPYDRFFKKPASAKPEGTASIAGAKSIAGTASVAGAAAITVAQPATSSGPATKRTIYVTMPGGMPARESAPIREPVAPVREAATIRQPESSREVVREIQPAREVAREITPVREAMPVRERISYTQDPVTEILPPLPRRKPTRLWLAAAIGGGVLALLAAGIFIGLSIQKNSSGAIKFASKEGPVVRASAQQLPVSLSAGTATDSNYAAGKGQAVSLNPPSTAANGATDKSHLKALRQRTDVPKTPAVVPVVVIDSSALQSAIQHREAVHRTDVLQNQPVDDRESLKLALANQVSVGANKYDVGTFGGIRNLQVTVTNRSPYSLDLVVVAVSYIQSNKKTYKTENLYFRGIGPGSALMLEAPKTSRGINVEYKITSINSKELGLSEPGTSVIPGT